EPDQCVISPPHGWDPSRVQLDDGACDGFLRAHQAGAPGDIAPMEYMTRDLLPTSWALADAYTSCDRWFSSLLGPTLPNRAYWHAATSMGAKSNDEVLAADLKSVVTPYHRLNDLGIEWAYYSGDAPELGIALAPEVNGGRVRRFYYDFLDDAAAGKLPPVVYIDPTFGSGGNDDHPPHHPALGQQLIAAVYTALATSPQWKNINLVITYDEHGGFFDHVAPGTAPDERAADGFGQLGFRVPAMVIGPYAKQSYVSSVDYEHTSCIKHLSTIFGFEPLNMRDAAANDLMDCIDLERLERGEPADPIEVPTIDLDPLTLSAACNGATFGPPPPAGPPYDLPDWAQGLVDIGRETCPELLHDGRDQAPGIAAYLRAMRARR
ncbi:MAG TPA: alkaline phosphatase family protein, partial [Kofleriaceae bacterium]|nr:alkaline phosphatase family protein [Kofleriaceae bacterium]